MGRRARRVLTDDLIERTEKARRNGAWRMQAWNEKAPAYRHLAGR